MKMCFFAVVGFCFFLPTTMVAQKKNATNYLSNTKTPTEIAALTSKIEKAQYLLAGEFSNQAQFDTMKIKSTIRQEVIGIPIWKEERKGEYWLYFGWYQGGVPERAITQSIWQITKYNRDTFLVTQYLLPKEKENNYYSEEWKKTKPFAHVQPKDLIPDGGCSYYIIAPNNGDYELVSKDLCYKPMSEYVHYHTMRIILKPEMQIYYSAFYGKDKVKLPPIPNSAESGLLVRSDKSKPIYATGKIKPVKSR